MKKISLVIILIQYTIILSAQGIPQIIQKPPVDTPAFFSWTTIQEWPYPAISNNGQYTMYFIHGMKSESNILMIHALNSNWKIALSGVQQVAFTDDSRRIIFLLSNDSLCILTLSDTSKVYIPRVKSFSLFMQGNTEWMLRQMNNPDKELILQNLRTGVENIYKNADIYLLSEDKRIMVLQTVPDTCKYIYIKWLNLSTNQIKEIWKGKNANNLVMDKRGKQLAFIAQDSNTLNNVLWIYKTGKRKADKLFSAQCIGKMGNIDLEALNNFSEDGNRLFLQLKQEVLHNTVSNMVAVNIWSYADAKLQSQQLNEPNILKPSYLAVIDLESPSHIKRIQQENETLIGRRYDDLVLVTSRKGESTEHYWSKAATSNTYLVTINNEKRASVPVSDADISPGNQYVTGYGNLNRDLYVYEIATGISRNITANIPILLQNEEEKQQEETKGKGLKLAGWLAADSAMLLYDYYDIWQVDPLGKKKPMNLTHGRSKKLQFRLANEGLLSKGYTINPEELLLLTSLNKKTKECGFYQLKLSHTGDPEFLFSGNYVFGKFINHDFFSPILKARDTNLYLVKREQADVSPNIFSTTDFKSFIPISNTYPEKEVNWLTSELINFTTSDSIQTQAILYKPEDFNPSKKYPLIIHYYNKKSDELNQYRHPVIPNGGDLDVAWFASHGYLVLLTDIHYKIGELGESVYKAVVGAARFLSHRPYVDMNRLGIQGHSFGGYETNYLIAHSKLFAAAVTSAGVCDLASSYGNLRSGGYSRQEYVEIDAYRMGTPPWQRPDLYTNNSPIFYVENVTTPLLLVHNKMDKNVHFEQGMEFFTALRRAQKKVWMLQYDNGGHGVSGEEYKDLLHRMTQFFNHYLKDSLAPRWMTRGIPAVMKGTVNGFELDNEIKTPSNDILLKNVCK